MPKPKFRRWKEKIDFANGSITSADILYARERRENMLIPEPMKVLRRMVDGRHDIYSNEQRAGDGTARVNCLGGFGIKVVRKLVAKGHVTLHRSIGHGSKHGGSNTINTTVATITDKGRLAYADWEKRMKGRI